MRQEVFFTRSDEPPSSGNTCLRGSSEVSAWQVAGFKGNSNNKKGLLYSSEATALRGYNRSRGQHLQQNGQLLTAGIGFKNTFEFLGYLIFIDSKINPLNAELNPICYLLALLGAHQFLHVSRIRVNRHLSRGRFLILEVFANNMQNLSFYWFLVFVRTAFAIQRHSTNN